VPHRAAGESTLLDEIPAKVRRVLDLGSGDGRLLDLVLRARPNAIGVALDFSPLMLERLQSRFAASPAVQIVTHDLNEPLPALGTFDAVVSSFAIHHLVHERKRQLYAEIWTRLNDGGVFCNQLLDVQTQLEWLRDIGFADVDCYWKWRELALLVGFKRRST
jgi:SAM-dependent methyltransferase